MANKSEWKLYQSIGICPHCQKNKLFGDERTCVECRAVGAEYKAKMYEDPDKRKKMIKSSMESKRKRKERRRAQGLCVQCGKRPADIGFVTCRICRGKNNAKKRQEYEPATKRAEWVANGKCFLCGDECEAGYKVCAKHHQMSIENAQSMASVENRKRIKELGLVSAYVR